MSRTLQSDYMHWAKTQPPVTYRLSASGAPHVRLDAWPLTVADLDLDGASHPRYPPLREAIAAHENVTSEQVVAADGTSMANMLALATLIVPGDEVLVEWPTYEPLLAAARFLGAEIRRVKRDVDHAFRLDPAAVAAAMTPRTRLIVLTNPHNPSGAPASDDDLIAIGRIAAAGGARVLVDEVYRDAVPDTRSAALLGSAFVATNSLTKVYGLSGLRCGWVLAEPALAERMWRLNDLFGVNRAHQAERLACFAFAHLPEIRTRLRQRLARNGALFDAFVAGRADLTCPASAYNLTAFPRWAGGDTARLDALLRRDFDTGVVPGHWFEVPDRFRVGLAGDTAALSAGLARLGAGLDALA
ncbi:MAG: pyridoxal phosphate-dependent aminotransferase [Pseudomonadota bacterium]